MHHILEAVYRACGGGGGGGVVVVLARTLMRRAGFGRAPVVDKLDEPESLTIVNGVPVLGELGLDFSFILGDEAEG